MPEPNTRGIVERYVELMRVNDIAGTSALLHDDFIEDTPQSGERIRGAANRRAVFEHYPGGEPQSARVDHLIGTDDSWVMTPSFIPMRIEGSGDQYVVVAHVVYPDGSDWHVIQLVRLKDGRIHRIVSYYGEAFPAPDWRAPYVERMPDER